MNIIKSIYKTIAAGLVFAALFSAPAEAATSVFILSNLAEADIVTGNGQITITLIDKVVNPTSVTDNLSAFIFTTSVTPGSESLTSSSAVERSITGNGAGQYADGANPVATGWALAMNSATTTLDVLGAGAVGPEHTITGSPDAGNAYSSANGSINGNGAHNPFLDRTATFTLAATGVSSATTILSAYFQFGTSDGANRSQGTLSTPQAPLPASAAPEPATYGMLSGGLLILLGARKRRS